MICLRIGCFFSWLFLTKCDCCSMLSPWLPASLLSASGVYYCRLVLYIGVVLCAVVTEKCSSFSSLSRKCEPLAFCFPAHVTFSPPFFFLLCRVSGVPLFGRRNWLRHGDIVDLQDPGGVSWQNDDDVLCISFSQSVGHGCGALQRDAFRAPACGERGRVYGARQRGALRHLLQDAETHHSYM